MDVSEYVDQIMCDWGSSDWALFRRMGPDAYRSQITSWLCEHPCGLTWDEVHAELANRVQHG